MQYQFQHKPALLLLLIVMFQMKKLSSAFPHKNLFITKIWDIFFKQGLKILAFSEKVTPFIFDKGTYYA